MGRLLSLHFMYLFTDESKRKAFALKTWERSVEIRNKRASEFITFFLFVFLLFPQQTTDGGGWTVFQRRLDGSVDFYRKWKEYKEGFGSAGGEYWLGLDNINRLTNQGRMLLRVDLSGKMLQSAHALYRDFTVSNEKLNYTLGVGSYTG